MTSPLTSGIGFNDLLNRFDQRIQHLVTFEANPANLQAALGLVAAPSSAPAHTGAFTGVDQSGFQELIDRTKPENLYPFGTKPTLANPTPAPGSTVSKALEQAVFGQPGSSSPVALASAAIATGAAQPQTTTASEKAAPAASDAPTGKPVPPGIKKRRRTGKRDPLGFLKRLFGARHKGIKPARPEGIMPTATGSTARTSNPLNPGKKVFIQG